MCQITKCDPLKKIICQEDNFYIEGEITLVSQMAKINSTELLSKSKAEAECEGMNKNKM